MEKQKYVYYITIFITRQYAPARARGDLLFEQFPLREIDGAVPRDELVRRLDAAKAHRVADRVALAKMKIEYRLVKIEKNGCDHCVFL